MRDTKDLLTVLDALLARTRSGALKWEDGTQDNPLFSTVVGKFHIHLSGMDSFAHGSIHIHDHDGTVPCERRSCCSYDAAWLRSRKLDTEADRLQELGGLVSALRRWKEQRQEPILPPLLDALLEMIDAGHVVAVTIDAVAAAVLAYLEDTREWATNDEISFATGTTSFGTQEALTTLLLEGKIETSLRPAQPATKLKSMDYFYRAK